MRSFLKLVSIRLPIAIRLFMAILLTAVTITLLGLWMFHLAMRDGFAVYVAQIEINKLQGLVTQLQQDYERSGHWPELSEDEKHQWLRAQFHHHMFSKFSEKKEARRLMLPNYQPSTSEPPPNGVDNHRPYPPTLSDSGPQALFEMKRLKMPPPLFGGFPDRLDIGSRLGLIDSQGILVAGAYATNRAPRLVIRVHEKTVGYLTLEPRIDPDDALSKAFFTQQKEQLFWIGIGCIVMSAVVAGLLARHFRRPIQTLMDSANHLIHGQYTFKNHINRSDELGDLGKTMNQLSEILSQHESSRRQWVADTSHELRTPVSVLQAQIEAMQDGVREPSVQHLQAMHGQVSALSRLLNDVYELARADVGQLSCHLRITEPWTVVHAECEGFSEPMQSQGLELQVIPPNFSIQLEIDADRIRQVVANLLENSRRYTDPGGVVRVSTELQLIQKERFWTLLIDDSLPSVSNNVLSHLGERFFRADSSRTRATGGAGLGLALSRQIAEMHGGDLLFEHSPLGGLRAILRLPVRQIIHEN
ncbi:ATP-binding protein [Aquirhabdus parva]|uniref:histidine kinase n=1 Tax=Aquirhabdus parva TaxID=2283318 RepID=A0A345P2S7_9GAMM|nr:ATP-binding protein [Aquirhabdus parva]AXI01586.1 HAMP domain-containing protein [Aquirhabdus parva]